METICVFDVDGVIFPNKLEGDFTEFDNDPWVERIPHRVVSLPNFHWLTSWLNRANENIHPAPIIVPNGVNRNGTVGNLERLGNNIWWKAQGLIEHLRCHPEVCSVVWVDDEIHDFQDSVDLVADSFPNVDFLFVCPDWEVGLTENDFRLIENFIGKV